MRHFFQVLVNTIAGVVATDHSLMEAASCMGASRLRVFFHRGTAFRSSEYLHRIRLGLSSSIICVIAAEMLVGNDGPWISDPELQDVTTKQPGRSQESLPWH